MYDYRDKGSALNPTEQLYTARGSQGMGTYREIENYGVNPEVYDEVVMLV